MKNLQEFSNEEVLQHAREALKLHRYAEATEFFAEYCDRLRKLSAVIPPGILASYGLALGHTRRLKEGIQICQEAHSLDRRNAHIAKSLAELYLLAGSRRKALDAIERGLRHSPDYPGLLQLRQEIGVRQSAPIPFLSRENPLNVRLGKILNKLKAKPKGSARSVA